MAAVLAAVQVNLQLGASLPQRAAALAAAGLACSLVGLYFVYFKGANEAFTKRSVADADLPAALERWAAWHRLRLVLCLMAFGLALFALA
jgi:hypothetical protein